MLEIVVPVTAINRFAGCCNVESPETSYECGSRTVTRFTVELIHQRLEFTADNANVSNVRRDVV